MDTGQLATLRVAEEILYLLSDTSNWYDETPLDGGPKVAAWRGEGNPEVMAEEARLAISSVVSAYIGHTNRGSER